MRQMELLGLKWADLDWNKQTLKVERQLERSTIDQVKFVQPKTNNGRRSLALGDQTITAMRRHYGRQNEERKAAGERWSEYGLIFTTKTGTPINYRNLVRDYKLLLQNAGLPSIRFYDLRHTAASLMLNHGIPVIVVSRRLGHAKPSITLDVYGHMFPSIAAESVKFEGYFLPGSIIFFCGCSCPGLSSYLIIIGNCSAITPTLRGFVPIA